MRIGAVIMASGEAKRFGENKLLTPFRGRPLIEHTLLLLAEQPLSKVLVVTRCQAVKALAARMGFEVCFHDLPDISDTIRLGIQAMADVSACLFFVADQPLLRGATVSRLLDCFSSHRSCIVRAAFDGRDGNPVLFPYALFNELKSLSPGETGGAVIRRYPELLLRVQAGSAAELCDVDTPADFDLLSTYACGQASSASR